MRLITIIVAAIVFASCSDSKTSNGMDERGDFVYGPPVDYAEFTIGKDSLGPVRIGMTLKDAREKLYGLEEKKVDAWDYGYDGGGDALLFSNGDTPVLVLIPSTDLTGPLKDSDPVLAIISLNSDVKTPNGAFAGMTAGELAKKYPNQSFELGAYGDEATSDEVLYDTILGLQFVFTPKSGKRVGDYSNGQTSSKAVNKELKVAWITID